MSSAATPAIFTRAFMLGIVGTLSAYLASWENADRLRDNYLERGRNHGDTFDFIIVGAGTAGSILANRLSEKYKVLLLDAGGEPHPFQAVPLLSNYLLNYPELDWRHVTMPQKQAFRGSIQSRASISQGRGLGGSSNLDYMMYLRGHPKDFDNWAEIMEDPSWSYKSVSEYFKSLEQYDGPWSTENHGGSGEMKIRPPAFVGLGEEFCHAARSNGYKQTDLNSFYTEGCDIINYPTKKGYRDSAYSSFLRPIKDRSNLIINKFAHVNKIVIQGNNDTASGVEYDRHGKSHIAYARKEIIVTAGALQTPKILMLSGIGLKSDLDSLGIPVKADLPVGRNLQDHLSVFVGPFFIDNGRSLDIDRDVTARSVLSLAKDSGPLTTTGYQAAAVVSSGLEKLHGGRNWPDLQLTMYGLANPKSIQDDFSHAYKLKKELLQTYLSHSKGLDSFSILVSGGRPKSTGTVKLLNRNPYAPLIINPNYFDKIYDVVVMVDGIKKALRIVENSTVFYNHLNTRFTRQILPGCESYRFRSDAYFECYVRTMSVSLGNVAGTAPMGSVLNSKLQVKGIKGLRVMDASIMPSIVTTNTGATVMMIAEKGADMLLTDWEGTSSEAEKDANLVVDKVKESATQVSTAILDTLKLNSSPGNKRQPPLNLDDLHKLTKSVGSLAAMLDPVASASVQDKVYTGSFDLKNLGLKGNTTERINPFFALATLTPQLKSQFGGLYQNLFDTEGEEDKSVKVKPGGKGGTGIGVLDGLKLALKPSSAGSSLHLGNEPDPLKFIQSMIKDSMKEIENITALSSVVGNSFKLKDNTKNNVTLDDIFGIVGGEQEELEFDDDGLEEVLYTVLPSSTTTTTAKTTTARPAQTTRPTYRTTSPIYTTTTTKPTTTVTTPKRPFIDYSYEVLPVPLTKSKHVSTNQQQNLGVTGASSKPSYSSTIQGQIQTIQIRPSPVPVNNVQIHKVPPVPSPISGNIPLVSSNNHKFKNLEALAQIQHQTLNKLKQKQQPNPSVYQPTQFQLQSFRNPPPPPSPLFPPPGVNLYPQPSQPGNHPATPSLNILPPPLNGKYPQYFQQSGLPPPPPSPPLHQAYDQMRKPSIHTMPNPHDGFIRPNTAQPTADPSNLNSAVHTIMNAKYAPPSVNPFASLLGFLTGSSNKDKGVGTESSVLKSLQLRANVDKLIYPFSRPQVSPIPITHRPTPPPAPHPMLQAQYEEIKEEQPEDDGIFAPIKDVLQPLTSIMKSPLSLLPNPFKTETTTASSLTDSLLPSFLQSSIFSHRFGPISPESTDSHAITSSSTKSTSNDNHNQLSAVLPRFFMNHSTFQEDVSPELFLLALANLTSELPKPFVLQPSKSFADVVQTQQSSGLYRGKPDDKGKKQLGESISDILGQLNNHHFASVLSSSDTPGEDIYGDDLATVAQNSAVRSNGLGANSANEILNLDYRRVPTTVKASVISATPKVKANPPVEFHKSPWAKEPVTPSKSLHFKIKIV